MPAMPSFIGKRKILRVVLFENGPLVDLQTTVTPMVTRARKTPTPNREPMRFWLCLITQRPQSMSQNCGIRKVRNLSHRHSSCTYARSIF